jgi:6-methylpretetramide 4-monooxygenase / 4-hydroxy-6-methylpretetramide 12a-monooxygenase
MLPPRRNGRAARRRSSAGRIGALAAASRSRSRSARTRWWSGRTRTIRRSSRSDSPPNQVAAHLRSRSIHDVSYARSPLVGEHLGPGVEPPPRRRVTAIPIAPRSAGTRHHLLLFGAADDAGRRAPAPPVRGFVDLSGRRSTPSRVPPIHPGRGPRAADGHISFCAAPADPAELASLDTHLDTYLVRA